MGRGLERCTFGWLRMACSSPGPHGQPDGTQSLNFDVVQERERKREWSGMGRGRKRRTIGWLRMACFSPGPHGQPDGTRSLNFDVVQG